MLELNYKGNRGFRLLSIYESLKNGKKLEKSVLATNFSVSQKTIQRDFDDLRAYLAENHFNDTKIDIKYDKVQNKYYLVSSENESFTNEEILALCKILLESRAFEKNELSTLINKLIFHTACNDKKLVEELIRNELHNYIPLKHEKKLLTPIWELSSCIKKCKLISIKYTRLDGKEREHIVKPVAIMFSEYYFYLIAYMKKETKDLPTVFRIDRITEIKETEDKFDIPYSKRFNDGDFRKRVQFMYSGELKRVTFEFKGQNVEAVLDGSPPAKIIEELDGVYTISAESYGDGIYMWLRSQGENLKIL